MKGKGCGSLSFCRQSQKPSVVVLILLTSNFDQTAWPSRVIVSYLHQPLLQYFGKDEISSRMARYFLLALTSGGGVKKSHFVFSFLSSI